MQKLLLILLSIILIVLSCQTDTERRDDYAIQGVDVSRYQSRVDWNKIAEQDIHFAFVKATESITHTDSLFAHNWKSIKESGIKRGAYHFFRSNNSASLQARHFISQVDMEIGDLPPVLDIELLGKATPVDLRKDLHIWLALVERHYGVKPIVYSNQKFYNKYLAGHFSDYPLWIARYNKEKPVLACGTDWNFWQYGNRGKLEGIDGYVDFNVFRTSWSDFEALCYQPQTILSLQ